MSYARSMRSIRRLLARFFSHKPMTILFVGNSLTYCEARHGGSVAILNDVPGLFSELADEAVTVKRVCEDGASLHDHLHRGTWKSELDSVPCDFVVLQEKSQFLRSDGAAVGKDLRRLIELIQPTGARPVIFCGPNAQALSLFTELESDSKALLAPVAAAWENISRQNPKLVLSMKDGAHPSPLGSYLIACAIYSTVFRQAAPRDAIERLRALERSHRLAGEPVAPAAPDDLRFLRESAWEVVRRRIESSVSDGNSRPGEPSRASTGRPAEPKA